MIVLEASSNDDEGGASYGFMAIVGALMLAVAAGAFYLIEPNFKVKQFLTRAEEVPTSIADAACKQLWVPVAKNTPTLLCYMTTNPERLCDPKERSHFALVVREYRKSRDSYDAKLMAGGFKAVAMMYSPGAMGDLAGMATSMNAVSKGKTPTGEQLAAANRHMERLGDMEAAVDDGGKMDAAFKLQQVPDKEIVARFREMAEKGLIAKSDFGWFVDPLVEQAVKDLGPVHSVCPAQPT